MPIIKFGVDPLSNQGESRCPFTDCCHHVRCDEQFRTGVPLLDAMVDLSITTDNGIDSIFNLLRRITVRRHGEYGLEIAF